MKSGLYFNELKELIKIYSSKEISTSEIINLELENEFALIWNISGNIKISFNNKDYEIKKNSISLISDIVKVEVNYSSDIEILIINKNFLYRNKLQKIISFYNILFYSSTFITSFQLSANKIEDKHFENTWDVLSYFVNKDGKSSELIVQNLLDYIFLLCVTKINSIDHNKLNSEFAVEVLRKFHILLEENFKEITEVKSYANLLSITPKTLYNISKRNNCAPPSQKIKNRRLILIKQLLETTEKSLKEIAEELNFCDIHSLSRFFKEETKISPSSYRKLIQKGKKDKF